MRCQGTGNRELWIRNKAITFSSFLFLVRHRLSTACLGGILLAAPILLGGTAYAEPGASASGRLQHLVSPGDDWSELIDRVEPGHEIILMPGQHMSASFDELHGTPEKPIIIRSVSPNHLATIKASRKGIRLREPRHVVIRDLAITDASISGISISGPEADISHMLRAGNRRSDDPERAERLDQPWSADVTIENVTIKRTGPRGQRHAIRLAAVDDVRIKDARIRGWGGSAIHVIASRNVRIEQCTLTGLDGYDQSNGIELRAGSRDISIHGCMLDNPGTVGIVVGGESRARDFRPPIHEPEQTRVSNNRRYETKNVRIERCTIRNVGAGFILRHAEQCTIRNNHLEGVESVVYLVLDDSDQHGLGLSSEVEFTANIFLWQPGDLRALAYAASHVNAEDIVLRRNLWWSSDLAERKEALGDPIGTIAQEQIMDIDPEPAGNGRPTNRRAAAFGPHAP